jgi:hypothetical protein
MYRTRIAVVCATILLTSALGPRVALADWRSLSGGFLPLFTGGVDFQTSLDSLTVAFIADKDTDDVKELYAVPVTGTTPIKLNPALVSGGDVGIFEIDPLSDRAVFSADRETDGIYQLYSTPMLGGTPAKLNPPIQLQGGGNAGLYSEFFVNPAIPVVAFIARGPTTPGGKVYSNATAGGLLNEVSFNLTSEQRILGFRISPAGDRIVYNIGTRSGGTNAFKGNLYSSLIGGGGNANLTEIADPLFGVDA